MSTSNHSTGTPIEFLHQPTRFDGVELKPEEARTLQRNPQIITVLSGCAWITFDERDIIVETGKQISLNPGKHLAVISSANRKPLVFSVRREPSRVR